MDKESLRQIFELCNKQSYAAKFPITPLTVNGKFIKYLDAETDSAWIGFVWGYLAIKISKFVAIFIA